MRTLPSLRSLTPSRTLEAVALAILALVSGSARVAAQAPNYDENRVEAYTLPDPLKFADGAPVESAAEWREKRRPEILRLFEEQMYGRAPGKPSLAFDVEESASALDDDATRKQIAIRCRRGAREVVLHLLLYVPAQRAAPAPVFLGLNFNGNHSIHRDPGIRLSKSWMRNSKASKNEKNRATEASRGTAARRWPVASILARGCALATAYYGDIDPDFDDGFQNGVHPLFYGEAETGPTSDAWGSIAAWAWGLSRLQDYLETDPAIDAKRVFVIGHSRLGKAALWAGATDERFAMVVSNNSGCGGAALSRRRFGETVARINRVFPHWFCANFHAYGGKERALPFDQHMLLALIAPRPVLVCSAEADRWADPRGEFLAAYHAGPVYRLLGQDVLESTEMPPTGELQSARTGYFIRKGKHDMTRTDWKAYFDFATHHGLLPR